MSFLVPIVPDGNAYNNPNYSKNSQAGAWKLEKKENLNEKISIPLSFPTSPLGMPIVRIPNEEGTRKLEIHMDPYDDSDINEEEEEW